MLEKTRWLLVALVAAASQTPPGAPREACPEDLLLAEAVKAIVRADYRGDRAELARQAEELSGKRPRRNRVYWAYWAGFAHWRRGINGFNETPQPTDLLADFERCAEQERAALVLDPAFEDARSALGGCLMGQMFLAATLSPEKRAAIQREGREVLETVAARAEGNPRSLWIAGYYGMASPPHDVARAEATYRRGLEAARREALSPRRDPWVPSWGAPELLMSLAYLHGPGPKADRALALAYTEGALAMVPDWHFVRDVLLPKLLALPEGPAAGGGSPGAASREHDSRPPP